MNEKPDDPAEELKELCKEYRPSNEHRKLLWAYISMAGYRFKEMRGPSAEGPDLKAIARDFDRILGLSDLKGD